MVGPAASAGYAPHELGLVLVQLQTLWVRPVCENTDILVDRNNTSISHGDGIFSDRFIVNFLITVSVEEFWKSVNSDVTTQNLIRLFTFWLTVYLGNRIT